MYRTSDYTVVRTHDGAYRLDRITDPYPGPVANITPVRDRAQTVTGWRLRPLVTMQGSKSRLWPSAGDAIAATRLSHERTQRRAGNYPPFRSPARPG